MACVDLPAFPLQLLLRQNREWRGRPAVVVDRDDPQGRVLWLNEQARSSGVLPGQRYAAALSLERNLRAGVVTGEELGAAVERVADLLRRLTPEVEGVPPGADGAGREIGRPGTFWLGAGGLQRLWPGVAEWARAIHRELRGAGFLAAVVVGFTRFGSYALARIARGQVRVLRDPGEERRAVRAVPLARLDIDAELRDALAQLGVTTLGELAALPATGLGERFGAEAHRWHRLAAGRAFDPLEPAEADEPLVAARMLEPPEADLERLLFAFKSLLDPLLGKLSARAQRLTGLEFALKLESGGRRREALAPAAPTLVAAQLLDLVRLRLESLELRGRVEEIEIEVRGALEKHEQLRLFAERPRRDAAAGARALARLRAEFGPAAVVCARLWEGHLPEARFRWEPFSGAAPGGTAELPRPAPRLVRRLRDKPLLLPPRSHHLRDDGWLIRGFDHGAVTRMCGPYVVAGGWWAQPVHREYHFADTRRGDLLWVFYDRRRRRWFLQGKVE